MAAQIRSFTKVNTCLLSVYIFISLIVIKRMATVVVRDEDQQQVNNYRYRTLVLVMVVWQSFTTVFIYYPHSSITLIVSDCWVQSSVMCIFISVLQMYKQRLLSNVSLSTIRQLDVWIFNQFYFNRLLIFRTRYFLYERYGFHCRNVGYMTWLPTVGICFGLISTFILAGVVVLALIPTYLPRKNISVKYECECQFRCSYR